MAILKQSRKKQDRTHTIFIRKIDKTKEVKNSEGQLIGYGTKWEETGEINIGSLRNPNPDIVEVRIEPISLESVHDRENKKRGDWDKWFMPWM